MIVLVASFLVHSSGYKTTRYFILAWSFFLIGITFYSLMGLGVIPRTTNNSLEIGSGLQMLLLSVGLGRSLRVRELETEKANAKSTRLELELIKKNLEPHFLMNSINATVNWMQENPAIAVNLLHELAAEMRMIVERSGKILIAADQEIDLCKAHLEVMNMRLDRKFTLLISGIQPNDKIPPFVLHTLIENGITHGFGDRQTGKFIIKRELVGKDRVSFQVFNDGNSHEKKRSGLGSRYIEGRLQEAFPGKWQFSMGPTASGWQAVIDIPLGQ